MTAHPFGAYPDELVRVPPRPSLARQLDADARHQARLEAMFPVARQIVEAGCHRSRAALLLLQISDEIVLAHFAELTEACVETGFNDGRLFLLERYANLLAVRDQLGRLRDVERLEMFRRGMAALAHGGSR